jgi:hypothetical protein
MSTLPGRGSERPGRPSRSALCRRNEHWRRQTVSFPSARAPRLLWSLPTISLRGRQTGSSRRRRHAHGLYRFRVVSTSGAFPYGDASELIASVLETRTLEVTTARADRDHPMLGGAVGGPYFRFRAVHDLVGHVATGYGFDPDGEYSAWLVQSSLYLGAARSAAATELHGEISALWATGQHAEHRAVLLDAELMTSGLADRGRCVASLFTGRGGSTSPAASEPALSPMYLRCSWPVPAM